MAQVLLFNGQQVGDVFLRVEPGSHLITPPVRRAGLFQSRADVNSESRNLLWSKFFYLTARANDNIALNAAIDAIQDLQGLVGDIVVIDGVVERMVCLQWTIDEVSKPPLPSGFGGRFCEELIITAVGPSQPVYPP
ncbi:MAG: hypothetical protein KF841_14145 [Phycisphaerae bacterium]|nr:hypothetical protein [Phycisphaerae bacterium]